MNYFKKHNIQSIKLENNKLIIKYNFKEEEEEEEPNSAELQQVMSYIQNYANNQPLTLESLQQSNQENGKNKPTNYLPYVLGGVGIVVLIIGLVWLSAKKSKE